MGNRGLGCLCISLSVITTKWKGRKYLVFTYDQQMWLTSCLKVQNQLHKRLIETVTPRKAKAKWISYLCRKQYFFCRKVALVTQANMAAQEDSSRQQLQQKLPQYIFQRTVISNTHPRHWILRFSEKWQLEFEEFEANSFLITSQQ